MTQALEHMYKQWTVCEKAWKHFEDGNINNLEFWALITAIALKELQECKVEHQLTMRGID